MRNEIYKYINNFISVILIAVAGITPLLFLDITTDFFDMPKLILLIIVTIVLSGLWIVSWIIQGKIVVTRTPLDIPLLVLLGVILASTFFSTSRNTSIYGIFPEVHGSAVSWVTYIILYFITVSHLKRTGLIKLLLRVLYVSGSLIAFIGLISYFQIYLPFEMAKGVNFTPTGSTFSANAFLLMLFPLILLSIVNKNKYLPQSVAVFLSVLFSTSIILTGSVLTYFVLLAVFCICILLSEKHLSLNNLSLLFIPALTSLLLIVFIYVPFQGNKLQELRNNFPKEVQLPLTISWKVAATTFRDSPFLGTGPATFLYNFTNYKPVEFNQLRYWSISFSNAHNELLQVLSTWGLLGFLSLVGLCGVIIVSSKNNLSLKKHEESNDETNIILSSLALSGLVAVALLIVHTTTLVFTVTAFYLLALFMMSQKDIREKVSEFSVGIKVSTSDNRQLDLLPILVFILFLVAAVPVSRRAFNAVLADYYHRLALIQASKDGTQTYQYLQKAETLNPYIDLYRVDMAQTNFALANALASQKGPTKENPNGTLTDQDKQTIQTLVSQAINEGRASVVLSPRSSRNWEVLAIIYRNITGVAKNSLTFALDAYGRAIQMDPLNPALRLNVGTVYYASKNYELAVRFFTDSINLKPDYINGYYYLAIALREKGDLQNARLVAEQAASLLQKEMGSQDYKLSPDSVKETKLKDFNTINELLNDIKGKIEAGAKNQTGKEPSPGQTEALQNPNLPSIDVPDLNNPPKTTTPPQVEENPDAQIPQISTSPTPTPAT